MTTEPLKNKINQIEDMVNRPKLEDRFFFFEDIKSAVEWLKIEISEREPDYKELMNLINIAFEDVIKK